MKPSKISRALLPIFSMAFAVSAQAKLAEPDAQRVDIATEIFQPLTLGLDTETLSVENLSHKINHPGASFIKVKFAKFSLPEGAYVELSDPDGNEVYRYDHNDSDIKFAMSVSSDVVHLRIVPSHSGEWLTSHGVEVESIFVGHSEQEMAEREHLIDLANVEPESTCGANERRDVACWESTHPTEFERSRPVARLLIGGRSLCTAWRVGPNNHLFTNNHCFDSAADAKNTEVWFNYQRPSCGSGAITGTVKVNGDQLLATDYRLDYTLFTVDNFEKIRKFGHFGLDVDPQQLGQRIYIPQHGSGNPKELAIESDKNSNGLCQIDQTVTAGRGSNTDMGYKCDTIGGSSGSPVLSAKNNKVIALHHYGNSTSCTTKLNRGARIELIWPQVSSHFGGVVPGGDNPVGNNPPVADIQVNCTERVCYFDASRSTDSDGSIVDYAWNFGDSNTANGVNVQHAYALPNTYQVTLVVTDNEGATASQVKSVVINTDNPNTPPVADFSFSVNNLEVSFTDLSTDDKGVVSHSWNFADGNRSLAANPKHTFANAGTYQVSLTVEDAGGERSSVTKAVTVKDIDNGQCNIPAWESNKVYVKGNQVSQNGFKYEAKWWNQGQSPANYSSRWAVWKVLGACN